MLHKGPVSWRLLTNTITWNVSRQEQFVLYREKAAMLQFLSVLIIIIFDHLSYTSLLKNIFFSDRIDFNLNDHSVGLSWVVVSVFVAAAF